VAARHSVMFVGAVRHTAYVRPLTFCVAVIAAAAWVPAYSAVASSEAHADPVSATATVLKVVDGDTVDVVDDVRGRLRIRLLGIDTPETKKPGYTVGCWGSGGNRVRERDPARTARRFRHRSQPRRVRPLRPHPGLPG